MESALFVLECWRLEDEDAVHDADAEGAAGLIWDRFVRPGSEMWVNLSSRAVRSVSRSLRELNELGLQIEKAPGYDPSKDTGSALFAPRHEHAPRLSQQLGTGGIALSAQAPPGLQPVLAAMPPRPGGLSPSAGRPVASGVRVRTESGKLASLSGLESRSPSGLAAGGPYRVSRDGNARAGSRAPGVPRHPGVSRSDSVASPTHGAASGSAAGESESGSADRPADATQPDTGNPPRLSMPVTSTVDEFDGGRQPMLIARLRVVFRVAVAETIRGLQGDNFARFRRTDKVKVAMAHVRRRRAAIDGAGSALNTTDDS